MAAALACYAAVALAALALIAVYIAAVVAGDRGVRAFARGQAAHAAGSHNAQFVDFVLREATLRPNGWIAVVAGAIVLTAALIAAALQLQRMVDVVWRPESGGGVSPKEEATKHAPQFALIVLVVVILGFLLIAGATIHGLMSRTHHLPFAMGIAYQGLDVIVSIGLITLAFLCTFAYLPPIDVRWIDVWPAALICAVLYERGQFALSVYIGQMDARSPYADAGALLVILLWLYYSAQIIVVGADLTKVLHARASKRVRA
jgi:membrane protein